MPLLLNALQAVSVRLVTPSVGVWFADVDLVLADVPVLPVGPCLLTLGTAVYRGTIDPRASGKFGLTARVRVLGGMGGWDKPVLPLHLTNPAGLMSTAVYAATAAEVLEQVVDMLPMPLGVHYMRCAGPASRVFAGRDWFVDAQGVTIVGPRLPLPMDPTAAELLAWDPLTRVATIASDAPIVPGTLIVDPLRLGEPLTVADVEQTWTADGGPRATCWCAKSPGSRLGHALTQLVAEKAGLANLRTYVYRVVLQDPATEALALQVVDPLCGAPLAAIPIDAWFGVPGIGAKVILGSEVLVVFANGDPTRPKVVGFAPGSVPLELELSALAVLITCPAVTITGALTAGAITAASLAVGPSAISPAGIGGTKITAGLGGSAMTKADVVQAALSAICAAGGLSAGTMTAALAPFLGSFGSTNVSGD